jgi:putative hemolysin
LEEQVDVVVGEIALVLAFILAGGFFAAAEMALVSLRPAQVRRLAAGSRRGKQVERLLASPNRFLSAVQIGVTLAGFLSSAFGAVTLARPVEGLLADAGLSTALAGMISVLVVTAAVAYVSLVLGELAPKRIAMQRAEGVAQFAAPVLEVMAAATRPVIWLLGRSTDVVVRAFGANAATNRDAVSEAELRDIVATNDELTLDERLLIGDVLDAGDRPIREVMTPRVDVAALPASMTLQDAVTAVRGKPHSRYPVVDGGLDDVVGFVHLRDLLTPHPDATPATPLRALARPLLRFPDSRRALPAMVQMRREGAHLAVVVDEYGGGAGIVALEDLIEELVGDITDEFDRASLGTQAVTGTEDRHLADRTGERSSDGAWGEAADGGVGGPDSGAATSLNGSRTPGAVDAPASPRRPAGLPDGPVEAQLRLEEFEEATTLALPQGPYDTAAGWLVSRLGRLPKVGDVAEHGGVRLTVAEVRRRRVERVVLSRIEPALDDARDAATTATPADPG